jgi:hypothetical protein
MQHINISEEYTTSAFRVDEDECSMLLEKLVSTYHTTHVKIQKTATWIFTATKHGYSSKLNFFITQAVVLENIT